MGRPFFMSKDNERSIENPFGGTRATTGRPYGIHFYLSKSKRFVNN